jgi:hypothetical protein
MNEKFAFVSILWDQKLGGVVEACSPKITVSSAIAMNLYNMHRVTNVEPNFGRIMLKLEDGQQYNVCTFFTGYGMSTSPDGFTGNYASGGKNIVGVSEHVMCLFLPTEVKAEEYDEVLAKISSRAVLNIEELRKTVEKIGDIIKNSNAIMKKTDLYQYLEKNLDIQLGYSAIQTARANALEVKALHYMIVDKNQYIRELTINPAKTAYVTDQKKIADAKESKDQIQKLINQVTQLSVQKDTYESTTVQKDEEIETLKADYIKIFGTLTDQIIQLEEEIKGITESTQGLLGDLNNALAAKIQKVRELEDQIRNTNFCKK